MKGQPMTEAIRQARLDALRVALAEAMPRAGWRLSLPHERGDLIALLAVGFALTARLDYSGEHICAGLTDWPECFIHRHPVADIKGFVAAMLRAVPAAAAKLRERADALALATPLVVTNDPARYIKRGDFVTTNDAIYLDRDAPGQPDRMTFASLEADADGYVTAQHDPT